MDFIEGIAAVFKLLVDNMLSGISFTSISFLLFILIGAVLYYIIPKKGQWIWLLFLGMFFYVVNAGKLTVFIAFSIGTSWLYGYLLKGKKNGKHYVGTKAGKLGLFVVIAINVAVLVFLKVASSGTPIANRLQIDRFAFLIPMGISFYTLQIIAYMVDVYKGKIEPEKNPFKYALFVSFFPQILQGPIPRYEQLAHQLYDGHKFDYEKVTFGLQLMIWGFFQKMVVADAAAIVVNRVFGEYETYKGLFVLFAGILYSIQLYADFAGCVCIAMGAAEVFGIQLADNFNHPYFSTSIKDFWRRWHISLSSWLRDYIYIPLGGNRKGTIRKYINLVLTFIVSGLWHGIGSHYIVWGLLHGFYQVAGEVLMPVRNWFVKVFKVDRNTFSHGLYKQITTFFLVMVAWIFFRADNVRMALIMLKNMVTTFNPWILFNDELYGLGLNPKESRVMFFGIFVIWVVSMLQEKMNIRKELSKQSLVFRWIIIFAGIFSVLIFGIYGPGYDASEFIYGNF